uniref:Glutaredoxin domain-containing protein n=1 Tax=Physcomitrium patens TaxID=3218 RepID=A0A2K1L2Q3_PHYPA|nr:hypothetical protein PHYPA_003095 [Physcomitrium patens]
MGVEKVQELILQNPLIIFSKSYCPYCRNVKELLKGLGAEAKVVELDRESEHIGGNDATKAAHKKGTLHPKLKNAGAFKKGKGEATKVEALTTKDTAKVEETKADVVQNMLKGVEDKTKVGLPVKDIVV